MKTIFIQVLVLANLLLSINQSDALIYDYRYQGYDIYPMYINNNIFPLITTGDSISIDIQLSQLLPSDFSIFNPISVISVSASDGTGLISTMYGASYSMTMPTDPTTGLPALGGSWSMAVWQAVPGGTHLISTSCFGWAGKPGFVQEGIDMIYYTTDTSTSHQPTFGPNSGFDGYMAENLTAVGKWTLSILDDPSPVPEPSTLLLLSAGLSGIFIIKKRTRV